MRHLFTSVLLLLAGAAAAQPAAQPADCLPTALVTADYPVTPAALERLFSEAGHRGELSPGGFDDLKARINRCNNEMEVALSGITAQMSELSLKYQQILGYKDVEGIEKQLRDLEESRKKSRAELEQNLGYVKHSGVFAVLLEGVDFYQGEQRDRIAAASRAVTARAVDDLVGVHITRVSEVRDFAPVRDVVLEIKNGEVRLEREYFAEPDGFKKQFLLVGRFGATPTRQKPAGAGPGDAAALVLNLSKDTDFRARLSAKGVKESLIRRIEQEVLPFLPNLQRDNKTADGRQDYILQNGSEEIRRIDRDIEDARARLALRSAKVGEICRELGVPFANSNFGQSVNAALQKIKDQMRDLTAQWNQTAEREVLYKDSRSTSLEGSLTQSLAAEALKICGQIGEGYGKLDRVLQVTEVENLDVSRFESSRTVTVFRAPRKIWAYAIPKDDGSYGVAVLVQLRVTGVQADGTGGSGTAPPPVTRLPYEPEMVRVEAGKYEQGCTAEQSDCDSDERNVHSVQISAFQMGKTEVTNEQFVAFLNDVYEDISVENTQVTYNGNLFFDLSSKLVHSKQNKFSVKPGYEKHPVVYVSWIAAVEYCAWLNQKTGKKYRLPTEAEWEYAARGGAKSKSFKYSGSNNINEVGWYNNNSGSDTHPVAEKKANELGLYDMSGNVWEWCADWYAESYPTTAQTNPKGPTSGTYRVLRGGSWLLNVRYCRVSVRYWGFPYDRYGFNGFRVAQDY